MWLLSFFVACSLAFLIIFHILFNPSRCTRIHFSSANSHFSFFSGRIFFNFLLCLLFSFSLSFSFFNNQLVVLYKLPINFGNHSPCGFKVRFKFHYYIIKNFSNLLWNCIAAIKGLDLRRDINLFDKLSLIIKTQNLDYQPNNIIARKRKWNSWRELFLLCVGEESFVIQINHYMYMWVSFLLFGSHAFHIKRILIHFV